MNRLLHTVLGAGERETTAKARVQASLGSQSRRVEVFLAIEEGLAITGLVGPAADRNIFFADIGLLLEWWECRVHPDIDLGVSSARLRAVSSARERALVLIQ